MNFVNNLMCNHMNYEFLNDFLVTCSSGLKYKQKLVKEICIWSKI